MHIVEKLGRWWSYGPKPEGWPNTEEPKPGEWVDPGYDTGYCHCGTFHE